jgi:hypothetical protein
LEIDAGSHKWQFGSGNNWWFDRHIDDECNDENLDTWKLTRRYGEKEKAIIVKKALIDLMGLEDWNEEE